MLLSNKIWTDLVFKMWFNNHHLLDGRLLLDVQHYWVLSLRVEIKSLGSKNNVVFQVRSSLFGSAFPSVGTYM